MVEKKRLDPTRWVDDHGDYLFYYALVRLQDRAVAEEVVQDTLVAALSAGERFRDQSSERTWLIGIMKHKIVDHFRKERREFPVSDLLSSDSDEDASQLFDEKGKWRERPAAWADDPRAVLQQKQFWDILLKCISGLPRRFAQVFSLREFEGRESLEICKLLGISATNLGVILHRARMQLRRCLEKEWLDEGT